MSNRSVTYSLYLNSNVKQSLMETESAAKNLDNIMSGLKNTLASVGVAMGIREAWNIGKGWLQDAADYETAMLKIKNSSENAFEAARNQKFIGFEADKFKISVQEATQDYGRFLAMISGSGMASEKVRELHDNFLMINKIQGLTHSEISRSVYDLGVLMTESRPDAMHLRGLTVNLHGFKHYLAEALGKPDEYIGELIHKKLTGSIPKEAFMDAIKLMAEAKEKGLPEALKTMNSSLNDASNAWFRFKTDVGASPEFRAILEDVRELAHWVHENEEPIMRFGKAILYVAEAYAVWKVAHGAIMLGQWAWRTMIGSETAALEMQTIGVNTLAAAIERLNFVTNASTAAFITNAEGITMANTAGNRYMMSAGGMGGFGGGVGGGAPVSKPGVGFMGGLNSIMLASAVIYISGNAVLDYVNKGIPGKKSDGTPDYKYDWGDLNPFSRFFNGKSKEAQREEDWNKANNKRVSKGMYYWERFSGDNQAVYDPRTFTPEEWEKYKKSSDHENESAFTINKPMSEDERRAAFGHGKTEKVEAPKLPDANKIRGNTVTTINIDIKQMNGMNNPVFSVASGADMKNIEEKIGIEVTRILTEAVNDSQLIAGHH